MAKFYTVCLLLFLGVIQLQAQDVCSVPNGSMEEWFDGAPILEEDLELSFDGEVPIPAFYGSLSRLLLLSFSAILGPELFDLFPELASDPLGLERVEVTAGNYGAKLSPGLALGIADLITTFPCSSEPDYLKLSISHVGSDLDSMIIVVAIAGQDPFNLLLETDDLTDLQSFTAGGVLEYAGGSSDATEVMVPIEMNDAGRSFAEGDSALIMIIAQSDSASLAMGNESYYIIDDLTMGKASTPTQDLSDGISYEVFPNPTFGIVNVQMSRVPVRSQLIIYNSIGKEITRRSDVGYQSSYDISDQPPGVYFMTLEADGKTIREKIIKR